jgi:hypothetical protein
MEIVLDAVRLVEANFGWMNMSGAKPAVFKDNAALTARRFGYTSFGPAFARIP